MHWKRKQILTETIGMVLERNLVKLFPFVTHSQDSYSWTWARQSRPLIQEQESALTPGVGCCLSLMFLK